MVANPRRGEVYWTRFDPVVGSEIGKTRPAVVIQNDIGNALSRTTIVAAVSSRYADRDFPFLARIPDGVLARPSVVNCSQVRTVDKSRLNPERVAMLDAQTMAAVDVALLRSLGLD